MKPSYRGGADPSHATIFGDLLGNLVIPFFIKRLPGGSGSTFPGFRMAFFQGGSYSIHCYLVFKEVLAKWDFVTVPILEFSHCRMNSHLWFFFERPFYPA